jgi:extradiol dioxygenase family protein
MLFLHHFLLRKCIINNQRKQMTNQTISPFHLAFPVDDLTNARGFYGTLLGCPEGRSSDEWVDFNFFGHQLVAHLSPAETGRAGANQVDGKNIPVRHFGVVLPVEEWNTLAARLVAAGTKFIIEPYTRFKGEAGEQETMFFLDPCGNALEFKAFKNIDMLFAK